MSRFPVFNRLPLKGTALLALVAGLILLFMALASNLAAASPGRILVAQQTAQPAPPAPGGAAATSATGNPANLPMAAPQQGGPRPLIQVQSREGDKPGKLPAAPPPPPLGPAGAAAPLGSSPPPATSTMPGATVPSGTTGAPSASSGTSSTLIIAGLVIILIIVGIIFYSRSRKA